MELAVTKILQRLSLLSLALLFGGWCLAPVMAADYVRYPVTIDADLHSRGDYQVEMLRLAIQKSGANLQLQAVPMSLNKIRVLAELKEGNTLDVIWAGADKEREKSMLPIRICLMKGLMGWRIPLVTKKNADLFANVKNVSDLRKFTAGQGYHWTDTQILQAAEIKVERSYEFEFLFRMLGVGRFDYFPRSVMEIWNEFDAHSQMDIAIDQHIVIHYPAAFYFFTKKDNKKLAAIIQRGLEQAIKDGSFDQLFYAFHQKEIMKANLDKRKVIEVNNPFLTPETPLNRKELWFTVKDLKALGH